MKHCLILLPLCLGVPLLFAAGDKILCTFNSNTSTYNAYSDESPSPDAMQLSRPVNAALAGVCAPNCPRISLFRNSTAADAMLIASGGQMRIVYKPEFFAKIYDAYGDGGIQAILAHEAGHAIDSTLAPTWMKKEWTPELRADAWTGCALAKIDLSPKSLKEALTVLSKYPPASAASWNLRFEVLRAGYMQCGGKKEI